MTPDPRKSCPSASSFPRYVLCPGSFALEQSSPPELPSEDAASGTRIHDFLSGVGTGFALDAEELEVADACKVLASQAIVRVLGRSTEDFRLEQRLWLPHPDDLSPLCSGQFDLFARLGKKVIVLDYKTGRDPVIAEESWQLRCLVALAVENALVDDDDELTVGIIQPWGSPQVRLVEYSVRDRQLALDATLELSLRILRPGEPRVPSEAACKYCRAKARCPDAQAVVAHTAALALPDGRAGEVLDGPTAAWLLDRCSLASRIIGGIQARAKAMLAENPDAIPGWTLKAGAMREKIVDVAGVWSRTSPLGIDPVAFAGACSLTKTNLKGLLRERLGVKGKALDEQVRGLIADFVQSKQAAPQLQRVGAVQTAAEEGNGDE